MQDPDPEAFEETVEVLGAVISFEMFQALAGPDRTFEEVSPQIARLARAALGIQPEHGSQQTSGTPS